MVKEYQKGKWSELSRRFGSTDFDCNCKYPECKITLIDSDLIHALDELWSAIGEFYISSGYRCSRHNKAQKGKPGSIHMLGKAADVHPEKVSAKTALEAAENIPLFESGGIGAYASFIHVDTRGHKSRWRG